MLPEIECEQYRQARKLTELVIIYEDGVDGLRARICVHDDPANTATTGDLFDVFDEIFAAAVFFLGSLREC